MNYKGFIKMEQFKIIVAGTRTFNDYELLKTTLDNLLQNKTDIVIMSGGAKGADALGERYAKENNYPVEKYEADWNNLDVKPCVVKYSKYGKPYNALAGHIRNEKMAQAACAAAIFWDGSSTGSKNMKTLAEQYNLKLTIIEY